MSVRGCDARTEARTQGAPIAEAIDATEDADSGRAARPADPPTLRRTLLGRSACARSVESSARTPRAPDLPRRGGPRAPSACADRPARGADALAAPARSGAGRARARARRRSRSSACPRRRHAAAARCPQAGRAATGSRPSPRGGGRPQHFDYQPRDPAGHGPPGLSSAPASAHASRSWLLRSCSQPRRMPPGRPWSRGSRRLSPCRTSTRPGRRRSRSTCARAPSSSSGTRPSRSFRPRTRSSRSRTQPSPCSAPATASTRRWSAAARSSATSGTAISGCAASATRR